MTSSAANILIVLLLAGICGMLGQGIRVLAGLKKMNDDATRQAADSSDLFNAARLVISLLIGFLAGIAAAFVVGLDKLLASTPGSPDLLLGIAAAGYAGTDFLESFAPTIIGRQPPGASGGMKKSQGDNGGTTVTTVRPLSEQLQGVGGSSPNVVFGSLVQGGFFSANPDDHSVPRSIRTNNPGALDYSSWQKRRPGYVGVTESDNSPNQNRTTIYRTPEHGVASWYYLLSRLYDFPGGTFGLEDLARRYAGGNDSVAIRDYIAGWTKWLGPSITVSTRISVSDTNTMVVLGRAMFSHEAGKATPLQDNQISFAIDNEKAGTLPA